MFTRRQVLTGAAGATVLALLPVRALASVDHQVMMLNMGKKGAMV